MGRFGDPEALPSKLRVPSSVGVPRKDGESVNVCKALKLGDGEDVGIRDSTEVRVALKLPAPCQAVILP